MSASSTVKPTISGEIAGAISRERTTGRADCGSGNTRFSALRSGCATVNDLAITAGSALSRVAETRSAVGVLSSRAGFVLAVFAEITLCVVFHDVAQ